MDIQYYLSLVILFIERNGWYFVGMVVLWYMVKDSVLQTLAERERHAALKKARDPNRVSILEKERKKARDLQQKKTEQEAIAARERMKDEKAQRTRKEEAKTKKPPSFSGHNPLDGGGGSGGGYRPPKRNVGRGG